MTHQHGGLVEAKPGRKLDSGASGHGHQLGESPRPLDAHHPPGAVVAFAILRTRIERHDACCRHPHSSSPSLDVAPQCVHHARAVDARNERQDGAARGFLAGAQTDVEHAVDGGGVNADADLAGTRMRVWYLLDA